MKKSLTTNTRITSKDNNSNEHYKKRCVRTRYEKYFFYNFQLRFIQIFQLYNNENIPNKFSPRTYKFFIDDIKYAAAFHFICF